MDELVIDRLEYDLQNVLHRVNSAFASRQAVRERLERTLPTIWAAVQSFLAERVSQTLLNLESVTVGNAGT